MKAKSITFSIEGQKETVTKLGLFDMKLRKGLMDLVKETSKSVRKTGKANAPVSKTPKSAGKKGDLKRSVGLRTFDKGLSATVVPRKPRGAHRHLVEYGTKKRTTKSGANRGKMPANPFMNRTEDSAIPSYNIKVRRIVEHDETI